MITPLLFDSVMTFLMCGLLFFVMTMPSKDIPRISNIVSVVIGILAVFLLGAAPTLDSVGTDRPQYAYMFDHAEEYLLYGFRDIGFVYFAKLCGILTGSHQGGFLISALIYVGATIYFCRKSSPDRYLIMVLLCFLSLGYTNHSYNILRAGLSLSFLLVAFSKGQHKILSLLLCLVAASFHISALLVIVGYLTTRGIWKTKFLYLFWIVVLIGLLGGIFDSFSQYAEFFSLSEEERFDYYLSGNDREYKVGLRLDFISYSLFPILVGGYYIYKKDFKDVYYVHIYNTYLFCNACWLMISKIAFNDRVAYLSWVFIPFILLYPILNSNQGDTITNKKSLLFVLISIIIGVNLLVKYV